MRRRQGQQKNRVHYNAGFWPFTKIPLFTIDLAAFMVEYPGTP
jgi:hypothetical protein